MTDNHNPGTNARIDRAARSVIPRRSLRAALLGTTKCWREPVPDGIRLAGPWHKLYIGVRR